MPNDLNEKIIEELAKQLPVKQAYEDAASPAAKEFGGFAADLMKCLRIVLAPLQYVGALQDRYSAFLDKSVRRVLEARRISPPSQILGPTLESIRYEPEETPIDEMFSRLLSTAMDSDLVSFSHPALPGIIRQLCPDEARLISYIAEKSRRVVLYADYDARTNMFSSEVIGHDPENVYEQIKSQVHFFTYVNHLNSLALLEVATEKNEPVYTKLTTGESLQTGTRRHAVFRLTGFGRIFAVACIGTPVGA